MRTAPTVLHVDMDAFFASVEILERPDLADKPVIVGGDSRRGVVASCNYQARRYGVHSAMSSARAKALCPNAVFLSGSYAKYESYSRQLMQVLQSFTPMVEAVSIDEAFLDIAGATRLFGQPAEVAAAICKAIFDELKLTASVGAATTKHLAKLASEFAKPKATSNGIEFGSGFRVVEKHEELEFLHALPVRAIWGVGPKTAEKLERLQIKTVGDLAHMPLEALATSIGNHSAEHLNNLAWNRDERSVQPVRGAKSVGHEQTFSRDLQTAEAVHERIVRLADAVSSRLRKNKVGGRTITVKIRYSDFTTITRSQTLEKATGSSSTVAEAASSIVKKVGIGSGIRLLGVSVSNLVEMDVVEQIALETPRSDEQNDQELDKTIDAIRDRYGAASVVPALLVKDGEARVLRPGERQWGPSKEDEKRGR